MSSIHYSDITSSASYTDYGGYIRYENQVLNISGTTATNAIRVYSISPSTHYKVSIHMQTRFRLGCVPTVTSGMTITNYIFDDLDTNGSEDQMGAERTLEITSGSGDHYLVIGAWSNASTNLNTPLVSDTLASIVIKEQDGYNYTVEFVDWDGSEISSQEVFGGESATAPENNPTRNGYRFDCWDTPLTNIRADTTVTATYIKTYVVTFKDWDEDTLKTQTVDTGGDATPPSDPSRPLYTFVEWSGSYTSVSADITVTAQYAEITTEYTVTFYDWDDDVLKTESVQHGHDATPPANPRREGYTFVGWSSAYTFVLSDLNITAQYESNSNEDMDILKQSERTVSAKVELLDSEFRVIGQLDGYLTEDSYTSDRSSDIRHTCVLTFVVNDDSLIAGQGKALWFNHYVRIYIGIYSIREGKTLWYSRGVYTWDTASYTYDATTHTLALNCLDIMASLNESRGSQISGSGIVIDADSDLRSAMVSAVGQFGGIKKYRIEDPHKTVPYKLEFGTGTYPYEVLSSLRDLYTGWEMFFDDEYFVFQPYPTCKSDPIRMDAKTIAPLIISEAPVVNFSSVKNVTEVWGECIECDYYTSEVDTATSGSSTYYNATFEGVSAPVDGTKYGFVADSDCVEEMKFSVDNGTTLYPIYVEDNAAISAGRIKNAKAYVLKYKSGGYFYFVGESQIVAVNKLVSKDPSLITITTGTTSTNMRAYDLSNEVTTNISYTIEPNSPFCCDLIGEIRQVLSDGEYASIYSEDLATQRAKYETWQKSDMLNTITITMIDVPWLDVNQKIEYYSMALDKTDTYIITQKSSSSRGGQMTLTCVVFQPEYAWL